MMGIVELSETEMLEMRYRSLDITREPFMYHWTWSGGGYDITCTLRVVPPPPPTTTTDSLVGMGTRPIREILTNIMVESKMHASLNTKCLYMCYTSKPTCAGTCMASYHIMHTHLRPPLSTVSKLSWFHWTLNTGTCPSPPPTDHIWSW